MKAPRWLAPAGVAGLSLALGLAWAVGRGEPQGGASAEPRQVALASREAPAPVEAAPPAAPPARDAEAPASEPAPREEAPGAQPEADSPAGSGSWVVPLDLGWEGAEADAPIRSEVPFRPARSSRGERFQARITDATGNVSSYDLPVRGLIPLELAEGRQELVRHDEVFLARAPVLLRLPQLALPARVELLRPDGELAASLALSEVEGELRARVE